MSTGKASDSVVIEGDTEFKGLGNELFGKKEPGLGEDSDAGVSESTSGEVGTEKGQEAGGGKKSKSVTPRQKAVNVILRRSGKDTVPDIGQILAGKYGEEVRIRDIGVFISDSQDDEIMAELAKECPIKNRVNLSAEVQKKRVLDIGAQIVEAGKMYQPISVARIKEDGRLECVSGRHRLVFLALLYGADSKIPVYIEEMTMNEARDAVVVSNQSRATKALERAEHTVLRAVKGDVDAAQDDVYYKTVTVKSKARQYCVYSVVMKSYPMKLSFSVVNDSSRKGGGLTTVTNVGNFWAMALDWNDGMDRKTFDAQLKSSVKFLNALVAGMQKHKGFDPKQHLAAMVLTAIGKYYRTYEEFTGKNPLDAAEDVAKCVVKMGEIARQKSEKTYKALAGSLAVKAK